MGDNLDDSFETDGVAVDYAGPGEAVDEEEDPLLVGKPVQPLDQFDETDADGPDGEGQVVDSVGPSGDVEEWNQMEPETDTTEETTEQEPEDSITAASAGEKDESKANVEQVRWE